MIPLNLTKKEQEQSWFEEAVVCVHGKLKFGYTEHLIWRGCESHMGAIRDKILDLEMPCPTWEMSNSNKSSSVH